MAAVSGSLAGLLPAQAHFGDGQGELFGAAAGRWQKARQKVVAHAIEFDGSGRALRPRWRWERGC